MADGQSSNAVTDWQDTSPASDWQDAPHPPATVSAAPDPWSLEGIKGRLMTWRDKAINQLPTVGGILGGVAAGVPGAMSGPGDILAAGAGAAAGGGLGETVRQALTEHYHPEDKKMTTGEAAKGIAEQAAGQGVSEMVGRGIGGIFRPSSAVDKLAFVGDMHPKAVQQAFDELQKTEKIPGNKVLTVGDYQNVLKKTKEGLRGQVVDALKAPVSTPQGKVPLGATQADTTPVYKAVQKLITGHPSDEVWNPGKLEAWRERASKWLTEPHSYNDIFDRRQVLNEELNRYEALAPAEKAIYASQHPNLAIDKAEADAIRDIVYPQMDTAAGKPQGYFRDLQHKYGSVIETERNTQLNLRKLEQRGATARGGPVTERVGASSYMTPGAKPGFSLHRVHGLLKSPAPEKVLDSRAKSAFGHSGATTVGNILSSTPSQEFMSLPLRELFNPDEPDQQQ